MAMFQDLRPGDSVRIGSTVITVQAKTGGRARLRIDSQEDVQVIRAEDADSDVAKPVSAPGIRPAAPSNSSTTLPAVPALKFG